MNSVHLETLLAIVDEGSFEYAATVLGITPSAVSQRIKSLKHPRAVFCYVVQIQSRRLMPGKFWCNLPGAWHWCKQKLMPA